MLYSYNKRFVFLSEEEDFPLPLCHLCIRTRHSARLFSPFSFSRRIFLSRNHIDEEGKQSEAAAAATERGRRDLQ